jgi:hypothetical protein
VYRLKELKKRAKSKALQSHRERERESERIIFVGLGVCGRIILKQILETVVVMMCTGFSRVCVISTSMTGGVLLDQLNYSQFLRKGSGPSR